ncbi:MAG: LytTR family DNA-binding domain-containing protein [Bacteroidota bacterium]
MRKLNASFKYHSRIAALLGAWSFLFAFFVRPFQHGTMDLAKWISVSLGYSLLAFLSYLLLAWLQKWLYEKRGDWNIVLEVFAYGLFYSVFALSSFAYYRSPIIQGFYSFEEYLIKIVLNVILVLTPLLFIARRYVQGLLPPAAEAIILTGENKRDRLMLKSSELVCISNAQNYVEIYYLEQAQLKKKLIRTSLKQLQAEHDFLLQIHRSHLINPVHFKSWKDANTILLTQMELPVSKTYKKQLQSL